MNFFEYRLNSIACAGTMKEMKIKHRFDQLWPRVDQILHGVIFNGAGTLYASIIGCMHPFIAMCRNTVSGLLWPCAQRRLFLTCAARTSKNLGATIVRLDFHSCSAQQLNSRFVPPRRHGDCCGVRRCERLRNQH